MSVRLPLRTDGTPFYSFECALDGESFVFAFRWNTRDESWSFDVDDAAGNRLVSGRKVVLDWPLLVRFRSESLPEGQLVATDTSGEGEAPSLEDFGTRVVLSYYSADEA